MWAQAPDEKICLSRNDPKVNRIKSNVDKKHWLVLTLELQPTCSTQSSPLLPTISVRPQERTKVSRGDSRFVLLLIVARATLISSRHVMTAFFPQPLCRDSPFTPTCGRNLQHSMMHSYATQPFHYCKIRCGLLTQNDFQCQLHYRIYDMTQLEHLRFSDVLFSQLV